MVTGHLSGTIAAASSGIVAHGRTSPGTRQLLAPADRKCAAGADPGHAPRLYAAADGVLRLRGDGADGGWADLLGQTGSGLHADRSGHAERLAGAAVDRQDGVRRAGRHRAAAGLAAAIL